jgi:pseudouridine-5'-phosphate glycosidase
MQAYFEYSTEVQDALNNKKPILALESTLITHGLPFPQNLETAQAVEELVREKNVTPATIAIIDGKIKVGLNQDELEKLVHTKTVYKASKRDLPYLLSKGLTAGTTVAATLFCADYAGIRVFATGGIGGVHHGDSFDISADLIELARTPIAVICAGAKAILDLPRTIEFLETYSIPVIGYGTETLPAFYTRETSYQLTSHVNDIPALAKLLKIHWQLGMTTGILIANPINATDEIPADVINPVITNALKTASERMITGKEVTPFLLSEVAAVTKGKSMAANISLIKNNVRLGADLAAAL